LHKPPQNPNHFFVLRRTELQSFEFFDDPLGVVMGMDLILFVNAALNRPTD